MFLALLALSVWALSQGSPVVASLALLLAWMSWGVTSVRARARELERGPLKLPPGWRAEAPTTDELEALSRRNILAHDSHVAIVPEDDDDRSRWVLCWVSPDEDLDNPSPTGVH